MNALKKLDIRTVATLLALLIIAFTVGYSMIEMGVFSTRSTREQCRVVEDAINKAVLQCYALEGSYPSALNYLSEHYGLVMDPAHFDYYYEALGANIRPEVHVYPRGVSR